MYTPSGKPPREDYLEGLYNLGKIVLGIIAGSLSGLYEFPIIYGILLWVAIIAAWFFLFKYVIGLDEKPVKLILLHGTFASFIAFVFFWGVFLGPPV